MFFLGFFMILAQVVSNPVINPQLPSSGGNAIVSPGGDGNAIVSPGGGSTSTSTTNVTTNVVNVASSSPAEVEASARLAGPAMMEAQAVSLGNGAAELATEALDLPDWLTSRPLDLTVDFGPGVEINDSLRFAALVLLLPAVVLLLLKHLAGPITGADPIDILEALPMLSFWSVAAWFNRPIQEVLLNGANALFKGIGSTVVHDAVVPGLTLSNFVSPVIGALILLAFAIVTLIVVGRLFSQLAWVTILCSCAPIFWIASATPVLDRYGKRWWGAWGGSVLDPLIVLIALKLGTPLVGNAGQSPDIVHQLLRLVILLIAAFRAPGFFQGAMGGTGFSLLSMWALANRYGPRNHSVAVASAAAPTAAAASTYTPSMPQAGAANAVTWKSAAWTPGGLGPHGMRGARP